MKFELKAVVAAMGLAAASTGAHAALSTIPTNNATGGDLFLTAWDSVTGNAYVRDLGVAASTFDATNLASLTTINFASDNNWNSFITGLGGTTGLRWNVSGGVSPSNSTREALTTSFLSAGLTIPTNAGIPSWLNTFNNLATKTAGLTWTTTGSEQSTTFTSTDFNLNVDGNGATPGWGNHIAGNWTNFTDDVTSGAAFTTHLFWFSAKQTGAATGATGANKGTGTVFAHNNVFDYWALSSNGTLTYNVSAAAVPVPAAFPLLGSALTGLVTISRRRRKA